MESGDIFQMIYHDLLDSEFFDYREKIVFIELKRYHIITDSELETSEVTLEQLSKVLDISTATIRRIIRSLEKKGAVKSIRRGLNLPNRYILFDDDATWRGERIKNHE